MREPEEGIGGGEGGRGGVQVMGKKCWELHEHRRDSAQSPMEPPSAKASRRIHGRSLGGTGSKSGGSQVAIGVVRGCRTRGRVRVKRGGGEGDSALGGTDTCANDHPRHFCPPPPKPAPLPPRIETPHVATTRACVNRETSRPHLDTDGLQGRDVFAPPRDHGWSLASDEHGCSSLFLFWPELHVFK